MDIKNVLTKFDKDNNKRLDPTEREQLKNEVLKPIFEQIYGDSEKCKQLLDRVDHTNFLLGKQHQLNIEQSDFNNKNYTISLETKDFKLDEMPQEALELFLAQKIIHEEEHTQQVQADFEKFSAEMKKANPNYNKQEFQKNFKTLVGMLEDKPMDALDEIAESFNKLTKAEKDVYFNIAKELSSPASKLNAETSAHIEEYTASDKMIKLHKDNPEITEALTEKSETYKQYTAWQQTKADGDPSNDRADIAKSIAKTYGFMSQSQVDETNLTQYLNLENK